jgi:hypothetical protein
VIAFVAMVAEILIVAAVDVGIPALVLVGGSAGGLLVFRTLRLRSRQAAPGEA